MSLRVASALGFVLAALLPAAAVAAPPVAVSPGAPDTVGRVATTCPTFSWTYDPAASAIEVAVYLLDPAETGAAPEEAPPVLTARLPAGAVSWTPDGGGCLEPSSRYVWFVRGETQGLRGRWSAGSLFEVRLGPGGTRVAAAVAGHSPAEGTTGAEEIQHPAPAAEARRVFSPRAASTAGVRPALVPTPKPPDAVSFRADGGVVIGGDYRFTEPRLLSYRIPPSAFRLERSDEDEGWRLQDGYGFVPTMSGAVADVHLVAPLLDLPVGARLVSFHCDGLDGVEIDEPPGEADVDDLLMTMALARRRDNSQSVEVLATTSMLTEGALDSVRSSLSGTTSHVISSANDYQIEVVYKPESQGSSLRFYGCSVRLEVDRLDPR